ncbi:hypothetical protein [Hymenobacter busanensis]|uniref:hypothetical protein n=1 Tax=Hymenobacter busanensis TaxID=2607656 RepID=UPI001366EFAC|nr:hypothetical protein [Hymenobacter busanensis]QHJ07848.1 hypothetical protein GUY19_11380 [Hymenobacter busanensis]
MPAPTDLHIRPATSADEAFIRAVYERAGFQQDILKYVKVLDPRPAGPPSSETNT